MPDSALIDAYATGVEPLTRLVTGLRPAQFRARPVPNKWSVLEAVCHLADSEALFAERMKRVLAEDRPTLAFSDPDRCVERLAYHDRDGLEEVALIGLIRRQMVRILRVQPAEAWERVGVHSKDGEQTLEQIVRKAVDHFAHHLRFLGEKREALESSIE